MIFTDGVLSGFNLVEYKKFFCRYCLVTQSGKFISVGVNCDIILVGF